MSETLSHLVAIPGKTGKDLSKLQKQFNTYSKKIDKLKKEVAQTTEILQLAQQKVNEVLAPLELKTIVLKADLLKLLDKHYDSGIFKKREKEAISGFITDHAVSLIKQFGFEELKPLFEKHDGTSFDEFDQKANEETGELMKNIFTQMGIELDENADMSDVNSFKEAYERKIEAEQAAWEESQAKRKKTAKQLEKEEKLRQEAHNVSKTVRSVYMQLVKEFHPDREPDHQEKDRKTMIMQRITQAYEEDDLFELLRLQLEYNQKDSGDFALLPDAQLKYYNKLMKEQIEELQYELETMQFGDNPFAPSLYQRLCVPAERLTQNVKREEKVLKQRLKQQQEELSWLENPSSVREILKQHKQMQKEMAKNPFGGMFPF